jgi:RNA-directed DNA polymerase
MVGLSMEVSIKDIEDEYKLIRSHIRNKKKLFFFEKNYYSNIKYIKDNINRWEYDKYNIFKITDPKVRIIMSEKLEDKIVNHLICRKILLPLDKYLIDSNCATRLGRGTGYARKLLDRYLIKVKDSDFYILRFDIRKYFYSINHNILLSKLKRYLASNDINIIKKILDTTNKDYVYQVGYYKDNYGLSIGCFANQFLAIYYLNDLDHYFKEELGCKYYIRYMDDGIILSKDKEFLRRVLKIISNKLNYEYDLVLNSKTKIYKSSEGFEFIGFRYKIINNRIIRRVNNRSRRRIRKKINKTNIINYNNYFKYEKCDILM